MARPVEPRSFDDFEVQFQTHFSRKYIDQGEGYLDYMPAYRLGYDLALNEILQNQPWPIVAREAQEYWEERRPGTWESFKDAIYFAWLQVRNSPAQA